MSDCGGLVVAALALPLVLAVLLVAGVTYLAIEGAKLVGHLAYQGIQLAGQGVAALVREASSVFALAGESIGSAASSAAEWTGNLFDSRNIRERLSSSVVANYHSVTSGSASLENVLIDEMGIVSYADQNADAALKQTIPTFGDLTDSKESISLTSERVTIKSAVDRVSTEDNSGASRQIARAQAVRSALASELPIRLVADRWYAEPLKLAEEKLRLAQVDLKLGQSESARLLADEAEGLYATAMRGSYDHLVSAERVTVAAQIGNTLQDMGYQVKAASSTQSMAMVGRKGHQVVAFVTGSGGKLEMDMAGFTGDSCDSESKLLLEKLRKDGLMISGVSLNRHGRFEGGALIRRAQRSGKPLETALLQSLSNPADIDGTSTSSKKRIHSRSKLQSESDTRQSAKAWVWQQNSANSGGRIS